ncbi:MAG: glycosyltransferase family 39 protein, partial [Patescibacteria group bacterium]|nr:glycosyltransferase family 39 protein [Patescibacteria group bacterium]
KKIILSISIFLIIFVLGKNILPFTNHFFDFHDETQPARISEFVLNLKNLHIPPRIAPNFSFNMGYPVFSYYAPSSYWLTSFFHLIGFSIIDALKISIILALIISFYSMYKFSSLFFNFYSSIFAGILYSSSPWIAVEIFIRGNLAELWFIAFLPLVFYFLIKNTKEDIKKNFILSVFVLAFILSVHNILSLILLPIIIVFILLNKNKLKNFKALFFSFLLNSYFFIPAFSQFNFIKSNNLLYYTNYLDHLLCPWQLWSTPFWGYGGSVKGCLEDGMSFMLGKPQIIFGILGIISFFVFLKKIKKENLKNFFLILVIFFGSVFMTTNLSFSFSKIFIKFLNFFQFPWRFLALSLFSLVFFANFFSFFISKNKEKIIGLFFVFLSILILFYNSKFFSKYPIKNEKFNQEFLSSLYIQKRVVYKISEYLPKYVDYQTWLKYEPKKNEKYLIDDSLEKNLPAKTKNKIEIVKNEPFERIFKINSLKENQIVLNIHYLPYWKIKVNENEIIPKNFDSLGRPIIKIKTASTISIKYEQTLIEKISNIITLSTFFYLLIFYFKTKKI